MALITKIGVKGYETEVIKGHEKFSSLQEAIPDCIQKMEQNEKLAVIYLYWNEDLMIIARDLKKEKIYSVLPHFDLADSTFTEIASKVLHEKSILLERYIHL